MPAATPVTTPAITEADPLLVLHVPPEGVSTNVIVDPTQRLVGPEMIPTCGNSSVSTDVVVRLILLPSLS